MILNFSECNILLHLEAKSKNEVLEIISKKAQELNYTESSKKLYHAFLEREDEYSTGLQDGFAIPHAKSIYIEKPGIIYVRLRDGIEWETYDGNLVTDIFALMVPENKAGTLHLQMLSKLAVALLDDEFKRDLCSFKDKKNISNYITEKIGVETL